MLKKLVLLLSIVFLSSTLSAESDFDRANRVAAEAAKDLDCEFEDCKPEPPKVIVKEKIVVKEKKVPVFIVKDRVVVKNRVIVKEVPVEKIVQKEKIVYRDRPAPVMAETIPAPEPVKAVTGRTYNKAFFDVHTKTQAPMLDYIKYSTRGSFNVDQFADTVSKIKEKYAKVYIHGSVAVPSSITTNQVYMNVGPKYFYGYYSYWKKEIFYNGSNARQNSDYFLVNVKKDNNGNRYVDYKISILLHKPWKINAAEENVAPNTFFFKMAPKVRGFKNKFVKVETYITE